MATHTLTTIYPTGRTLYAWPIAQSLTNWATYRVLATEAASPDLGKYPATVNDANGNEWVFFEGATQPASLEDAVTEVAQLLTPGLVGTLNTLDALDLRERQLWQREATWQFDVGTGSGDPGVAKLRYNHATPASVTTIYVSTTASIEGSAIGFLDNLISSGHKLRLYKRGQDSAPYAEFAMTGGALLVDSDHLELPVSHVTSSGAFADDDYLTLALVDPMAGAPAGASLAADVAAVDGNQKPFLNRQPDIIIPISKRHDKRLTKLRARIQPGETKVVAWEYPDSSEWLDGMDLPVSSSVAQLTVNSSAYGVNRNLAMVEVTCPSGAAVGTNVTLTATVNLESNTDDVAKMLFEVIDPEQ